MEREYKVVIWIVLQLIYCCNDYVYGEQFLANGDDYQDIIDFKDYASSNDVKYQAHGNAYDLNIDYNYEPFEGYGNSSDLSKFKLWQN